MNPTPTNAEAAPVLNGTLEDVAAFFRVSPRTVKRWISGKQGERLGHWKQGGALAFGEDDVVAWWVRYHRDGGNPRPGEAEAQARRLWRAHMRARQEAEAWQTKIEKRLALLELAANLTERQAEAYGV